MLQKTALFTTVFLREDLCSRGIKGLIVKQGEKNITWDLVFLGAIPFKTYWTCLNECLRDGERTYTEMKLRIRIFMEENMAAPQV